MSSVCMIIVMEYGLCEECFWDNDDYRIAKQNRQMSERMAETRTKIKNLRKQLKRAISRRRIQKRSLRQLRKATKKSVIKAEKRVVTSEAAQ